MSAKRFLRSCAAVMLAAVLGLPAPVARAAQPAFFGVLGGHGSRTLCLYGMGANGDTTDMQCTPVGTFDPVAHTATFNAIGGDGAVTASMLASGAAKANLSAELPNLSASVQGTGQPGLNGGHWFIWNQPGSFDSTESLRVTRNIPTGLGNSGSTYKSIWGTSSNNPSSLGYEWTITGEQNTFSNATGGAQNVASNGTIRRSIPLAWASATTGASGDGSTATVTFSGGATIPVGHAVNIAGVTPSGYNGTFKVTASSSGSVSFASATTGAQTVAGTAVDTSLSYSAGMNGNCIDNTGEPDPVAPCIGAEFDVTVSSATTDANKQRVGVQVNANGTSGMHAGLGILLGTGAGITWDRGLYYTGTYGIGADFSAATITGNAITLAQGQTIGFDTNWAMLSSAGTMALKYGGANKLTLDSGGGFNTTGNIATSANITSTGYLKGAAHTVSGAVPANSGSCAINTQLGGNTAGSFKANGACAAGTIILTLNATFTPPNGWACKASDLTTPADLINQTAYTTSTATFSAVTMAASDLVTFSCIGF
jgi:hypothetical protein